MERDEIKVDVVHGFNGSPNLFLLADFSKRGLKGTIYHWLGNGLAKSLAALSLALPKLVLSTLMIAWPVWFWQ